MGVGGSVVRSCSGQAASIPSLIDDHFEAEVNLISRASAYNWLPSVADAVHIAQGVGDRRYELVPFNRETSGELRVMFSMKEIPKTRDEPAQITHMVTLLWSPPTRLRGLRLRDIKTYWDNHKAAHTNPNDSNMYNLVGTSIKRDTALCRSSLAEIFDFAPVETCVSHYWGMDVGSLIEALDHHCAGDEGRSLWVCAFASDQFRHRIEFGSDIDESPFVQALRAHSCEAFALVLDDEAVALHRAWCLYEVVLVLESLRCGPTMLLDFCTPNGVANRDGISSELDFKLTRVVASIDIAKAACSEPADHSMISDAVSRRPGGVDAQNKRIRTCLSDGLQAEPERLPTTRQAGGVTRLDSIDEDQQHFAHSPSFSVVESPVQPVVAEHLTALVRETKNDRLKVESAIDQVVAENVRLATALQRLEREQLERAAESNELVISHQNTILLETEIGELKGGIEQLANEIEHLMARMQEMEEERTIVEVRNLQLTDEIQHCLAKERDVEDMCLRNDSRLKELLLENEKLVVRSRSVANEVKHLTSENERLLALEKTAISIVEPSMESNQFTPMPQRSSWYRPDMECPQPTPEQHRLVAKVRDLEKERLKAEMEIMRLTGLVDCDSEIDELRAEIEHLTSENKRIAVFEAQNAQLRVTAAKLLAEKKLGSHKFVSEENADASFINAEKRGAEETEPSCCFCS